jgi:hypothetical protein
MPITNRVSLAVKGDQKTGNQAETRAIELDLGFKLTDAVSQHRRAQRLT